MAVGRVVPSADHHLQLLLLVVAHYPQLVGVVLLLQLVVVLFLPQTPFHQLLALLELLVHVRELYLVLLGFPLLALVLKRSAVVAASGRQVLAGEQTRLSLG